MTSAFFVAFIASQVLAQSNPESSESVTEDVKLDYSKPSGLQFDVSLFAAGGQSMSEADIVKEDPGRNGWHWLTAVTAQLATPHIGVQLGVGALGEDLYSDKLETPAGTKRGSAKVLPYVEAYPFLYADEALRLGPVARFVLGEYGLTAETEKKRTSTAFAGLRGVYQFNLKNAKWLGIGLEYAQDINQEARVIQHISLTAEFGWSLQRAYTKVITKKKDKVEKQVVREEVEKKIAKKVVVKNVAIVFDSQMINFEFDKAVLSQQSAAKLVKLGQFLTQNHGIWQTILIEGHTDNRGTKEYNLQLSSERAKAVVTALVQAGLPEDRLRSIGFGPDKPVDPNANEVAWARNRRVEIKFSGVTDEVLLKQGVAQAFR